MSNSVEAGKVVLTGAGGGIGLGLAQEFARLTRLWRSVRGKTRSRPISHSGSRRRNAGRDMRHVPPGARKLATRPGWGTTDCRCGAIHVGWAAMGQLRI